MGMTHLKVKTSGATHPTTERLISEEPNVHVPHFPEFQATVCIVYGRRGLRDGNRRQWTEKSGSRQLTFKNRASYI
jgi:hypothetical protein